MKVHTHNTRYPALRNAAAVSLTGILFFILTFGCSKTNKEATEETTGPASQSSGVVAATEAVFAKGADISWVTEMEYYGKKFYTKAGVQMDCFALMKSLGMNSIRLRVWVNPNPTWCNTADVVAKAVRAKNQGMRIMIDFHYSDVWADPGVQTKPYAWRSMNFTDLKNAMAAHTKYVLQQLKNAGVTPEWVQVGNETNSGLLWPDGSTSNPGNYAQLITTGYDAVKSIFPAALVIVHLSNGFNNALFVSNIGGLVSRGAKFDIIGMSLYPTSSNWQSYNSQCLANMNDMVARYNKSVIIAEVGMPWDAPAACKSFLNDLMSKIKQVRNGRGLGVFYWEPEAYNDWYQYRKQAFDNSGRPTIALDPFLTN